MPMDPMLMAKLQAGRQGRRWRTGAGDLRHGSYEPEMDAFPGNWVVFMHIWVVRVQALHLLSVKTTIRTPYLKGINMFIVLSY